ncbi:MAG: coenzyme F420-0:L-glutamate ligase [Acidobacteria bacterium]|nr:coenzyme F420-0:L-glutamate ligase [Acidobacteriota bacterium]
MPVPCASEIRILPLTRIPEVVEGDSVAGLVLNSAEASGLRLLEGDVLVIAQKIVSKAEGRVVRLGDVEPSEQAVEWAKDGGNGPGDARHMEIILRESAKVLRRSGKTVISQTRHGWKCAHAGVDRSNVPGADTVSLLPVDADRSARKIREEIEQTSGAQVAVIVSDTFGRPWRLGLTNVAIGAAGLKVLKDYRGQVDSSGRRLTSTVLAVADELAAAAGLVMGKTERVPAVVLRGCRIEPGSGGATNLIRPEEEDLFR